MRLHPRRLPRRLPLMIASLLLGFLVWMLVIAEEQIEAGFMVPLVFDNIPPTVVIDGPPMESVYVQMRGSKQAIGNVLPQQIQARVDLSGATPGDEFVQVTPQDVVFPPGIAVLGVYPPYLDLKFLAKKPVPVEVRVTGKPAEGYTVAEVTSIPLQIEVVGPQHRVERIKKVETYPVEIGGRNQTLRLRAQFVQPGDDIRLLQLTPTEAVVVIEARTIEKTLRGVTVEGGNDKAEISPTSVTVVVSGPYNRMKELTAERLQVRVDWEAADAGDATRPLKVTVPQGITVLSTRPEKVKLK